MRWKLVIGVGLGLYTLLSVTDWLMTFALLGLHPNAVEANPIAAACLERYGWNGLAIFKAGGVLTFTGAVVLLARRRPRGASGVVAAGCAVLLAVTVYTHSLIREAHQEAAQRAQYIVWPKIEPRPRQVAGFTVPERCWFAEEPTVAETALK